MSLLISIVLKAEIAIEYYTHTGSAENDRIILVVRPRQRRSIGIYDEGGEKKKWGGRGGGETD